MNRHRNRFQKTEQTSKLDEFPEDFDDVFFHNQTVEQNKRIPILRNIVFKKIRNAVVDRVAAYDDTIPLEDKFNVEFEIGDFDKFQWGVIREELMDRGFDPHFEFDEKEELKNMIVPIERTMNLKETLDEKRAREAAEEDVNGDCDECECDDHAVHPDSTTN